MEATSVSNSPLDVIDAQLEMVLLIADANRRVRVELQKLVTKRREEAEPAKLRLVMHQIATEIGIDTGTLNRLHEGTQAFLPSPLGQKVLTYFKMENDWDVLKQAYLRTPVSDGLASIALFPTHLIRLCFDIRMQLVGARDLGAVTDDLGCALGLSVEEFESVFSGKIELIRSLDPELNQTGQRYQRIRTLLDGSDLGNLILECMKRRQTADQTKLAEIYALRDKLIRARHYFSEAEVSRQLFGKSGFLSSLRYMAKTTKLSEARLVETKTKLEAEVRRLEAGGQPLTSAPSEPEEEMIVTTEEASVQSSAPEIEISASQQPAVTQTPPVTTVHEITDLAELALTDGLRLLVNGLRHQVSFLMNLGDRHAERFTRIWGRLSPDIEDLRDHLQALYADSPSAARQKLARLQRERSKRSLITG